MKHLVFISLFLLQASCGFNPAYKVKNNEKSLILSSIEITPISTIEGTYFYNHLKSIFPSTKSPKYILNTQLSFNKSYNIIQPNSDILRETQNINVNYQLLDKQTLKIVTSGNFHKMNSYSVNFSLYSNTVLGQDSTILLAESAAEEVRNRLIMFFSLL
jgi:hypothetical protein